MTQDNGGPAFPCPAYTYPNGEINHGEGGMTLRQYAAIKLRTPDSGTDWLDDMIRASLRDGFAAKALAGMLSDSEVMGTPKEFADRSYALADAMLQASKQPVSK